MTKILIIIGHPDPAPERLCRALANAYAESARRAGHDVRLIDIALLNLPLLRTKEDFETNQPPQSIVRCQEAIRWAEHIVFVYPLWLGTLPALLKGFLEQTFRPAFAFSGNTATGRWKKLLAGRSARIVVTMGMPALIYRFYYAAHGLRSFERNILNFVGIGPIRETLIGMVDSPEKARAGLERLEKLGADGA